MAKGKGGSGKTYVSKGERRSSMSTKKRDAGQRLLNQMAALKKGKNVVFSLPNVDKDGKVYPNTIVKVNSKDYLNRMKKNPVGMKEAE